MARVHRTAVVVGRQVTAIISGGSFFGLVLGSVEE